LKRVRELLSAFNRGILACLRNMSL
jgi:hypothetical protein